MGIRIEHSTSSIELACPCSFLCMTYDRQPFFTDDLFSWNEMHLKFQQPLGWLSKSAEAGTATTVKNLHSLGCFAVSNHILSFRIQLTSSPHHQA